METDLPRFVDLQYLAITTLVNNKAQLNELMKGMGGAAHGDTQSGAGWRSLLHGD